MKEVPILIPLSNRAYLIDQTLNSLKRSTKIPYKIFMKDGMLRGEMKTLNELVSEIDIDWDWLVRSDDDMFYSDNWLAYMIQAIKNNPDVKLLSGCKYPTHKILEKRKNIYITEIAPGNNWLLSKETFEEFRPFYEDFINGQPEDVRYCKTLQNAGFKVGCLRDQTKVIHCGIVNTIGKGRSEYVNGYSQALADIVGAETNLK